MFLFPKGVTIVKPIVYGNVARYFGKKREEDGHTHQWTVYVKPYRNEVQRAQGCGTGGPGAGNCCPASVRTPWMRHSGSRPGACLGLRVGARGVGGHFQPGGTGTGAGKAGSEQRAGAFGCNRENTGSWASKRETTARACLRLWFWSDLSI